MTAIGLLEHLEDKQKFRELASYFIDSAVEELTQEENPTHSPEFIRAGLEMLSLENTQFVFDHSQSPIETIFLNSLDLCFIKNGLPLIMMPDIQDVLKYISMFKAELSSLADFADWYEQRDSNYTNIDTFFTQKVNRGAMPLQERNHLEKILLLYRRLNFQQAYHLVIQAGFPEIKVSGKSIRTDLLFWIPSDEGFKLVVECDGFQYHSDRNTFINDRKRDRILLSQHIQVMRFSGNEINTDPAGTATELFDYLLGRM